MDLALAKKSIDSQQNKLLPGARLAHFQGFLHEAPPGRRLIDGKENADVMRVEKYLDVKKNRRKGKIF